jgi:hypothetical protein
MADDTVGAALAASAGRGSSQRVPSGGSGVSSSSAAAAAAAAAAAGSAGGDGGGGVGGASVSSSERRKASRGAEPHISVLDAAEVAVARRWAAATIRERTGLDMSAVPAQATAPGAGAPLSPAREGNTSTLSTLLRRMMSPSSSSPTTTPASPGSSLPSSASWGARGGGFPSAASESSLSTSYSPTAGAGGPPLPGRILGVPLQELLDRAPAVTGAYRLRLPAPMHEMLKFLRKAGRVDMDGVFRVSGAAKHIDELHALFAAQPALDLETVRLQTGVLTTHDVAALLKLFIRSLPEPLATANFERLCPVVQQLEHGHERIQLLQLFYISLPAVNRDCFESLVRFLHRVARERNKMNATNLALVFAPALLTLQAQQDLKLHHHVVAVLKVIISRYDEIFKPAAWLAVRDQVLRAEADAAYEGRRSAFDSVDDATTAASAAAGTATATATMSAEEAARTSKLLAGAQRQGSSGSPGARGVAATFTGFFAGRRRSSGSGLRRSNTAASSGGVRPTSGSELAEGPLAAGAAAAATTTTTTSTTDSTAPGAASTASPTSPVRSTSMGEQRRRRNPPAIATSAAAAAGPAAPPPPVAAPERSQSEHQLRATPTPTPATADDHANWTEDLINTLAEVARSVDNSAATSPVVEPVPLPPGESDTATADAAAGASALLRRRSDRDKPPKNLQIQLAKAAGGPPGASPTGSITPGSAPPGPFSHTRSAGQLMGSPRSVTSLPVDSDASGTKKMKKKKATSSDRDLAATAAAGASGGSPRSPAGRLRAGSQGAASITTIDSSAAP